MLRSLVSLYHDFENFENFQKVNTTSELTALTTLAAQLVMINLPVVLNRINLRKSISAPAAYASSEQKTFGETRKSFDGTL